MEDSSKRNKINSFMGNLDKLKVAATLLVVLGHVTRMYSGVGVIEMPKDEMLTWVTTFIYSFHMPLFVFISGAIYYICKRGKNKYKHESAFISKKIQRLLIPYMFFALFYVFPTMILLGKADQPIPLYIIRSYLLSTDAKHLWFLLMLFNVFVIFNHFEFFIWKNTKTAIVLFGFLYALSYITPSYFQIASTLHYVIYFYIGYLYQKLHIKTSHEQKYRMIFIITHLSLVIISNTLLTNYSFLHPLASLTTSLLGIGATIVIIQLFQFKGFIFQTILRDSYGIYLYHPMIIYLLFYWLKDLHFVPWVNSFLIFGISILLSFLFIYITKKLRLSFIIGEA